MANRKMALAQDVHLTIWPKTIGAAMNGLPAPKKNHIACSSCSTCESGAGQKKPLQKPDPRSAEEAAPA